MLNNGKVDFTIAMAVFLTLSLIGIIKIEPDRVVDEVENFLLKMNEINNFNIDVDTFMSDIMDVLLSEDCCIIFPRMTIPAIVERGGEICIIGKVPVMTTSIFFQIVTAYDPIPESFDLALLDIVTLSNDGLIGCTAELPAEAPPEIYNLTMIVEETGDAFTAPKAVCMKEEIDGNFTFVHLTDFHIGDPRGLKENPFETIGWKSARRCVREINLLNPDFVVITGDLVYGQLYPGEYKREYSKCWEILQEFDVPIYLCSGNHDGYIQMGEDGFKYWKRYFGPLYYSFDYGDAHFVCVNSYNWTDKMRRAFLFIPLNWGGCIQEKQLRWIERDLDLHGNAKLKFVLLHHNPLWDTWYESLMFNGYKGREELLSIIREKNVDAVLAGHVHCDSVIISNDTLFITTTTASSGSSAPDAYWGYRPIKVENYTMVSYNYMEPKYSLPSYKIDCVEKDSYSKIITNDLNADIDVRITFLVDSGNYTAENGEIYMTRTKDGQMEVYVDAHVPARSRVEVRLLPV